jgi:8-oxo-dGTP pyrophosphatase MutT (NUDIX family)
MLNRATLIQQLEVYKPFDGIESSFVPKFLKLLQKENCYTRQNIEAHITASAWITNTSRTAILLLHHAKLMRWLQPGGHSDGNENLEEVMRKEVEEETGLSEITFVYSDLFDIDIHTIPSYKNIPQHDHYDVRFLIEVSPDVKITKNNESNALKWIEINQIPNDASMQRMKEKLINL